MKKYIKKGFMQKIIISVIVVFMLTAIVTPTISNAGIGGTLFSPIKDLFMATCDAIMWLIDSTIGSNTAYDSNGLLKALPTFDVTPETIFSNQVPFLSVNVINPPTDSPAYAIQNLVSGWYKTFRNIAAVGLLSVLVYIAIKILLSSAAADKAKYKTMIKDWLVAFCLLFFMHYIITFSITMVETVSKTLAYDGVGEVEFIYSGDANKWASEVTYGNDAITDNGDGTYSIKLRGITNYIRYMVDNSATDTGMFAYTILFMVLTGYTVMFLIVYVKRLIYIIFLIIISPLVALSYPLDKMKDGSSQGFNTWLREFVFNLLIQPLHMLLLMVLIGSAFEFTISHPIYALIVFGSFLQAEKVLRKMFGFEKAKSLPNPLGGMIGGAAIMKGFSALTGKVSGKKGKDSSGAGKGDNDHIRTADALNQSRGGDNVDTLFDGLPKEDEKMSSGISNSTVEVPNAESMNGLFSNNKDKNENINWGEIGGYGIGENIDTDYSNIDFSDDSEYAEIPELEKIPVEDLDVDAEKQNSKAFEGAKTLGKGEKFRRGIAAVYNEYGKDAIAGAAEKLGKGALKAYGAAAGATLGVASGLMSDNMANVLTFGAAGTFTGSKMGEGLTGMPSAAYRKGSEIGNKMTNITNTFEEASMTEAEIKERRKKMLDEQYKRSSAVDSAFKKAYKGRNKITYNGKSMDYWQYAKEKSQEFRNFGITDVNTIIDMQKVMEKRNLDISDKRGIMAASLLGQAKDEKGVEIVGKRLGNKYNISKKQIDEIQNIIRQYNKTV